MWACSPVAAAVIWAVVNELLIQPLEYTCFNHTLKLLQDDPRVTVRLGTPVSGYGQESRNRQARQRIPHRIYKDAQGTEKVLVCPIDFVANLLPVLLLNPRPMFCMLLVGETLFIELLDPPCSCSVEDLCPEHWTEGLTCNPKTFGMRQGGIE